MTVKEFRAWKQKTIVGVSLKLIAPTGQYDPTVLINPGNNRWAFKPEVGLSRRWGQWVVDTYGAVWFFTTNPDFFSRNQFSPGTNTQSQGPIGALEGHLSYDMKWGGKRSWVSLDGNFWYGGRTSLNGVVNPATLQANSRIGATGSIPVSKHQSLKFSYSYGAISKFGGKFQNVSAGWQYSWLGRPN
jgi:cytochrome P450